MRRFSKLTRVVFVILIVCLLITSFIMYRWVPWRTHLVVNGTVVDAATNQPVRKARVVVIVVQAVPFSERHLGYGAVTDKNGNFTVDVHTPIGFNRTYIRASTPDDKFASESPASESVTLHAEPLPAKYQKEPWMHYDNFRGSIALVGYDPPVGPPYLTFVNEPWPINILKVKNDNL